MPENTEQKSSRINSTRYNYKDFEKSLNSMRSARTMRLEIQYLDPSVEKIAYQTQAAASFDLRARGIWVVDLDGEKKEIQAQSYAIKPGERILVKTGVAIAIPKGHWGNIRDRSGLAMKHGLHTLGGVIDEDYRGEIGVILINLGTKPVSLEKNDRIAQMIIQPYVRVECMQVPSLATSARGEGGFGSTGRK